MAGAVRAEKDHETVNVGREGQRGRGAPRKRQVPGARKTERKSHIRSHSSFLPRLFCVASTVKKQDTVTHYKL